jgi:hypothetical protein
MSSKPQAALAELVEQVAARLNGRILGFHVAQQDGGLVLSGRTKTYHAKQLAQQYVMEMTTTPIVSNLIEVT